MERSRIEQRERLGCAVVTAEASASLMGSSGAGMTLQSCPRLVKQGGQTVYSSTNQLLDVGCPVKRAWHWIRPTVLFPTTGNSEEDWGPSADSIPNSRETVSAVLEIDLRDVWQHLLHFFNKYLLSINYVSSTRLGSLWTRLTRYLWFYSLRIFQCPKSEIFIPKWGNYTCSPPFLLCLCSSVFLVNSYLALKIQFKS